MPISSEEEIDSISSSRSKNSGTSLRRTVSRTLCEISSDEGDHDDKEDTASIGNDSLVFPLQQPANMTFGNSNTTNANLTGLRAVVRQHDEFSSSRTKPEAQFYEQNSESSHNDCSLSSPLRRAEELEGKYHSISWIAQLKWLLYKNFKLISRSRMELCIMLLSTLICSLLALVLTNQSKVLQLVIGAFGGALGHAVCVFQFVHMEIENRLVGVLRSLGVRDSIYWSSWFLVFALSSLINAILGALVVSFSPFDDSFPSGIVALASYFFLNLALTSASFATAVIYGRNNISVIVLPLALFTSVYVPLIQCYPSFLEKDGWNYSQTSSHTDVLKLLPTLVFLYSTLAWYWIQVFTAGNGRSKPFLFFLHPKYWRQCKSSTITVNNDCMTIDRVTKSFQRSFHQRKVAVDDMTFEMERGEITVLLGRNASGKTTLCRILSGELKASSGTFMALGHDLLSEDTNKARHRLIGICKQDNYLWNNLSTKEHLVLFAGLRGEENINSLAEDTLKSLHLKGESDKMANALSLGMKRRLSVGLSSIGSCPVIILDEPTTGVDPFNCYHIWNHIQRLKSRRTVLLVSHSMEEADLLADKVIVMCDGRKVADGTPVDLKAQYGKTLQIVITVENDLIKTNVVESINEIFANEISAIRINNKIKGRIELSIEAIKDAHMSKNYGVDISQILSLTKWVKDHDKCEVKELGSFLGSLEDVFLSINEDYNDGTMSEYDQNQIDLLHPKKVTIYGQVSALIMFNIRRKWQKGGYRGSMISCAVYITFFLSCLGFSTLARNKNFDVTTKFLLLGALTFIFLRHASYGYKDISAGLLEFMELRGLRLTSYVLSVWMDTFFSQFTIMILLSIMLYLGAILTKDDLAQYSNIFFKEAQTFQVEATLPDFSKMILVAFIFAIASSGSVLLLLSFVSSGSKYNFMRFISGICMLLLVPYIFFDVLIDPAKDWFTILKEDIDCPTTQEFPSSMKSEEILTCIYLCSGLDSILYQDLVASKYLSLVPVVGAFQGILMSLRAVARFDERMEGFNDKFCRENVCMFPLAESLNNQHIHFFLYGALIMNLMGVLLFMFVRLPSRTKTSQFSVLDEISPRTEEVALEKEKVFQIIQPMIHTHNDADCESAQVMQCSLDISQQNTDLPPILTYGLRKVYSNQNNEDRVALGSLDLAIPKGEMLALLGNNGSGKSTVLSILSSCSESTSGIALLDGRDLKESRKDFHEVLGSCPQHDLLWDHVSVRGHLELFAGLVGISGGNIAKFALSLAEAVGLGNEKIYGLTVWKLSGGMRRRLSLAISLINKPNILLLDEPTTGLDPLTRHFIWQLISSYTDRDKSVIITTHMVEEADVLSDRIGILAEGELQVIEEKQKLKEKYSKGYLLQLHLSEDSDYHRERAIQFVRDNIYLEATLSSMNRARTLYFNLPHDMVNIENTLKVLCSTSRLSNGYIDQFSLSKTSLEHIYFLFCNRAAE
ncbi:hypothetical protein CTEN210_03962 [Chaetoceros tenuissimus]|uniref:ABC transporter domain-containing protein n=1 Tax=Chaetoceros tenuissimus TaxID=426638 RepID=A0AAD3CK05_9STRA|nr:hypothetical protein CTEN210_03962 [Chaetoceros tenuissimus]